MASNSPPDGTTGALGPRSRAKKLGAVGGARMAHTRVKTARGRKVSSTRWLQRQLNDPYVAAAREKGYKSRAAFKLIELDDKFNFLRPGRRIVDLGAAPGGWTQVAVERSRAGCDGGGTVVGLDVLDWGPHQGAHCLTCDFLDPHATDLLQKTLKGCRAHVVMSDMVAPITGHARTDHLRVIALLEAVWAFAEDVLKINGDLVCKVLQGGAIGDVLKHLKPRFRVVKHVKPSASRKESSELYLTALGYKGP